MNTKTHRTVAGLCLGLLILTGAVLWEGAWAWNPHEGTITAVAHDSEGLKAFYTFSAGTFTGYILDPHWD